MVLRKLLNKALQADESTADDANSGGLDGVSMVLLALFGLYCGHLELTWSLSFVRLSDNDRFACRIGWPEHQRLLVSAVSKLIS